MLRHVSRSVLIGIVALGLVGCTQVSRGPNRAEPVASHADVAMLQPQIKTIGFARWPLAYAKSLKEFTGSYSTIVVGVVTAAHDLSAPAEEASNHPQGDPLPAGHPKAGLQLRPYVAGEDPPTLTGYAVTVNTVIKGVISPGDTLKINQAGGMLKGVAYQVEHDPVIQVGATYLFFLNDADGSALEGPPYGRFQIGKDNRLTPVDPSWEYLGAVQELSSLTMNDALGKMSMI
jgi:hypothetical protein